MAKILVGWELGSERGHVALIAPVVHELCQRGHDVSVAVKNLTAISGLRWDRKLVRVFQAPVWPPTAPGQFQPMSQTVGDDLSSVTGICIAEQVQLRAQAWANLIDVFDVDLVLAESAPTLLLAARRRCRALAFGSAYLLPPPGLALPSVADVRIQPSKESAVREEALRKSFHIADRALGGDGLHRFSDIFSVPTWVCNLPELDPYSCLRSTPAPGPLEVPQIDERALRHRVSPSIQDRVFVYAKPSPVLTSLMASIAPRCRQIEVYIANAPANTINTYSNVTLHKVPLDLHRRLPEFSAVVHFGGLNLTAEALFAGVPQLILPQHLEQNATALAVTRLGVGHALPNIPTDPGMEAERLAYVQKLAHQFFTDSTLANRAAEIGAQLRQRQQPSLAGLLSRIDEVIHARFDARN